MEQLNTGLTPEALKGIVDTLNKLLADEQVLYNKTRNYHWNVVGPRFHQLHEFFEEQYDELAEIVDEVAENVRQFGGFAAGTMTEFLQLARLKEHPGNLPDEDGMIGDLVADHDTIIRQLREDIEQSGDEYEADDAADFLTAILETHNKMAWMLRSFLTRHSGNGKTERVATAELVGDGRK
ncbi:MAG: DNA starvation/stationary phase protection protein [Bryobacteraceae bacterium]|nr:DNA starvation/stationary phase protection protein [Bryobacteraceae bacterium]